MKVKHDKEKYGPPNFPWVKREVTVDKNVKEETFYKRLMADINDLVTLKNKKNKWKYTKKVNLYF